MYNLTVFTPFHNYPCSKYQNLNHIRLMLQGRMHYRYYGNLVLSIFDSNIQHHESTQPYKPILLP